MVPFTNKVEIRIREKVRIKRLIFIDSHQTAQQKCQVDSEYMSLEIKTEPGLEKHSEKAIGGKDLKILNEFPYSHFKVRIY